MTQSDRTWRPKNWEDVKFHECMGLTGGGGDYASICEVFEAGAEAMFDALLPQVDEDNLRSKIV